MVHRRTSKRFAAAWMVAVGAGVFGLGLAGEAFASGGYGGSGGGFGGSRDYGRGTTSRTDTVYERGKRVARGRAASKRGFKVCLSTEAAAADGALDAAPTREAKSLNRRTLRPYRDGRRSSLVANLVDCENAAVQASSTLSARDMDALVYYLNKRYKLDL